MKSPATSAVPPIRLGIMWCNFHDAILHDEPIVATIRQSFENMLVVLRALESAEQGQRVEVEATGVPPPTDGVPLWRPRGAEGLFDGLPCRPQRVTPTSP